MIKKAINYIYYFYKAAQTEKLIKTLDFLEVSEEIKTYVLLLPNEYKGLAINFLKKNKNTSSLELTNYIENLKEKNKSKENSLSSIETKLPFLPEKYKKWFAIQIKKYPDLEKSIVSNKDFIIEYIEDNFYDINNFNAEEILTILVEGKKEKNIDDPAIKMFFDKVKEKENSELVLIENKSLKNWASKKLEEIRKEWLKNIFKHINKTKNSFENLVQEMKTVYEGIQQGEYRGREIPNSPLRNHEFDKLLENLPMIRDYVNDTNINLTNESLSKVIENTKKWEEEQAKQGKGLSYNKISKEDIVAGPNWKNKEFNRYIIVELKTENDLKVEGFKMNHCVGGYGEQLKNKECRIFSIRNVANLYQPLVTIETDSSAFVIRQDYGPNNSEIEQKYKDIIEEWHSKADFNIKTLSKEDKIKLTIGYNTPAHILELLAKDSDESVRESIARNPNTPLHILELLAKDNNHYVRENIANNPNTPAHILKLLTKDFEESVRASIARNANIPVNILELLAKDNNHYVRTSIAKNPNTPAHILELLAKNSDQFVKEDLASNHQTNPLFLEYLFENDEYDEFKFEISRNPNTPNSILEKIIENEDVELYKYLLENKNISSSMINDIYIKSKNLLELEEISEREFYFNIIEYICNNNNTSEKLLEIIFNEHLKNNPDYYINYTRAIIENPNTSEDLLKDIYKDQLKYKDTPNIDVLSIALRKNIKTPKFILENILNENF